VKINGLKDLKKWLHYCRTRVIRKFQEYYSGIRLRLYFSGLL